MKSKAKRSKKSPHGKRGPSEELLTVDGDWQEAIKAVLKVPRPPVGWPVRETKKRHRKLK